MLSLKQTRGMHGQTPDSEGILTWSRQDDPLFLFELNYDAPDLLAS